jgi:hypothetical protein
MLDRMTDLVDCLTERGLMLGAGLLKTCDFANKLERRRADFLVAGNVRPFAKPFDTPTHAFQRYSHRMPNRFTRVPGEPVPDIGNHRVLLAMADTFMLLMLSRPATGSLARTWVTPSSRWLSAAMAAGLLVLGVLLVAGGLGGGKPLLVVLGAVLLAFAAGGAAVAGVGWLQIRARRSSS